MAFRGWPAEAITFYEGLEADNSKTYFAAHKDIFESAVVAPFRALSDEIEATYGPLHLFRPYRDVRFSRDKSPYKTAQGAVTESEGGAIYYVALSSAGIFAGSGYYRPAPDQLARMREAIDDPKAGPVIEKAVAAARKAGYEVGGDALKTAPKGYAKDHPRIELLRMKGLTVGKSWAPAKWMQTAKAKDRIVEAWRASDPVNSWLAEHVGPSTAPPDDARWD
jgi:uncharacterized protein (TIGR02453 family)